MEISVTLRMLEFMRDDRVDILCLDTDIAVSGKTEAEARQKMNNATTLYMNSFSLEEFTAEKYRRAAPIKYRLFYSVISVLKLWHRFKSANAAYSSSEKSLRFA